MSLYWTMLIQSIVFTTIKTKFSNDIKEKYNMTSNNFSTDDGQNKKAVFPFVYINQLAPVETGMDLEGDSINGGVFTFQIDITDNQSNARAREVSQEVLRIMKTMRFEVISMPSFDNSETIHRMTARFRRVIGASDTL